MTQQEKLEAYCAYLPYGVELFWEGGHESSKDETMVSKLTINNLENLLKGGNKHATCKIILRPMSDFIGKGKTGRDYMNELGCTLLDVHNIWALAEHSMTLEQVPEQTMRVMKRNKIDYLRMIESGDAISIHDLKREG